MTHPTSSSPLRQDNLPIYSLETSGTDARRLQNAEWLIANTLGGFAMGTALGVPTRRYHALLNAAATPPVGRIKALHSLADRVVFSPGTPDEHSVELAGYRFDHQRDHIHPDGVDHLVKFEHLPAQGACRWTYHAHVDAHGVEIVRELTLPRGTNAACVRYFIRPIGRTALPLPWRLVARPMIALGDMHTLRRRDAFDRFAVSPSTHAVSLTLDAHTLALTASAGFTHEPQWWYGFFYAEEAARGQDCVEDLFSPGEFVVDVGELVDDRAALTIIARFDDAPVFDADQAQEARRAHVAALVAHAAAGTTGDQLAIAALVTAADAFVVRRERTGETPVPQEQSQAGASIIAGYPWFSDWGRDACIALPGLLLTTGRFDEARRVLLAFAALRHNGIIPNCFADQSGQAEYNTVDASLWFVLACCGYARASRDDATFRDHLAPACLDILDWYRRGTDHGIGMDPEDFLIAAGSAATQLTWMDARRDGVTFTPRFGKPVEINALWHSALRELSQTLGTHAIESSRAADLRDLGEAAARSFRTAFWNARANCLFDRLTPPPAGHAARDAWHPEDELRPNQLLAVSLPHSPLSIEQQHGVLAAVKQHLLTPVGVRTLAPGSSHYEPRYEGTLFERDRAYHNGTAWPWLLGPYAEGVLRAGNFSPAARQEALAAITPLIDTLVDTGSLDLSQRTPLGSVAEIYDAQGTNDEPQRADGCPMQAWSIAELLRVYVLASRR